MSIFPFKSQPLTKPRRIAIGTRSLVTAAICGWCKDKWGFVLADNTDCPQQKAVTDPDPAAAKRTFDAMMQMRKIDIAAIEVARRG